MTLGDCTEMPGQPRRTTGNRKSGERPSTTSLSTIAVQTGQSQLVVSVLRSGSVIHLQLVQIHPGLCEIGTNLQENQVLIQDLQQLQDKLKKHEPDVLAMVEKKHQTEVNGRRQREGRRKELVESRSREEDEQEVYQAMAESLREGWSLLLHLLERRHRVLKLAAQFHLQAQEFADGIHRLENLHTKLNKDKLAEVRLTYNSLRRDLLRKSLHVLNSSNQLLHKLQLLQKTEALQRKGEVLQEEQEEETSSTSQTSWYCGGAALLLEELVEELQGRRRRADQTTSLLLQELQDGVQDHQQSTWVRSEDWTLIEDKVLDPVLQSGSTSGEGPKSRTEEPRNPETGSKSDVDSGSRLVDSGSRSDLDSGPDLQVDSETEETKEHDSESRSELQTAFILEQKFQSRSDPNPECTLELDSGSRYWEARSLLSESESTCRPDETDEADLYSGFRGDLKPGPRPNETRNLQSKFRFSKESGFKSSLKQESLFDLNLGHMQDGSKDPDPGSKFYLQSGSRSDVQPGSRPGQAAEFRSEKVQILKPNFGMNIDSTLRKTRELQCESRSEEARTPQIQFRSDLQSGSRSTQTVELQCGMTSDVQPDSGSGSNLQSKPVTEENQEPRLRMLKPESRLDIKLDSTSSETKESGSEPVLKSNPCFNMDLRNGSRSDDIKGQEEVSAEDSEQRGEDSAHLSFLIHQRKELLSSFELLEEKLYVCLQQSSSVLSQLSSETGTTLRDAEDNLNSHLHLYTQAESAEQEAQQLEEILGQLTDLQTRISKTSPVPLAEPSRRLSPLSPLQALTQQLRRGRKTRTSLARLGLQGPDPGSRVRVILEDLQSLRGTLESNLQVLGPMVSLLKTSQQVKEEEEELREEYWRRTQEKEEALWKKTLQNTLRAQELGDQLMHTVTTVSGRGLNLQSLMSALQQTVQQLHRTRTRLEEQQRPQQVQHTQDHHNQIQKNQVQQAPVQHVQVHQNQDQQQQKEVHEEKDEDDEEEEEEEEEEEDEEEEEGPIKKDVLKEEEEDEKEEEEEEEQQEEEEVEEEEQQEELKSRRQRLLKTLQDLVLVSELLDSSSRVDLGSQPQASRLQHSFREARPHFSQLNADVEFLVGRREGLQEEEQEVKELLVLHKKVKQRIQQSESILQLSNTFHLKANQLEALLRSDSSPESSDPSPPGPDRLLVQNHLEELSQVKRELCAALSQPGGAGFRVELLEARFSDLDSVCRSWFNKDRCRRERVHKEQQTRLLLDDITQLRESFRDVKKRFSNLRFNFLKRNERSRNLKALRNHQQQVELHQDKLQALKKRVQGVMTRLGSEVRERGVAREVEDAANELQRMMGELERGVCEHRKTLDLTHNLQQAVEEYQLWCEEASATISRVGRFSAACSSTEAVAVLYRQFEKFVWPTVPQQEERISQITELAIRLHGLKEGRRYVEKTVSKHAEMVESIRELSDGLLELEAKLKLEALKRQQDEEEEEEEEWRDEGSEERGMKMKEKRKMNDNEQRDNRSSQEAADMYELKETGHTPELTAEHDGREVPVKKQTETNGNPPLVKSKSQEVDLESSHRQKLSSSSFCSTHTVSLSHSPQDANRRLYALLGQSQPAPTKPQVIHNQSQPAVVTTEPLAMPTLLFSNIQKNLEQIEEVRADPCEGNQVLLQEACEAAALLELQQDAMTEDSLSNDEYECPSPDDISLPPLAETPESSMVHSDNDEGFCFSSHSVHIHHYSHQNHAEPAGSIHSSTRVKSDVGSLDKSPAPCTLNRVFRTSESSTMTIPHEAEVPSSSSSGLKPNNNSFLLEEGSNKAHNAHDKQGPSPVNQNVTPKSETTPQNKELKSQTPEGSLPKIFSHNNPPQEPQISKCSPSLTLLRSTICEDTSLLQSIPHQERVQLHKRKVNKPQRGGFISSSNVSEQNFYLHSSSAESHVTLTQDGENHHQEGPRLFATSPGMTDPVLDKDRDNLQDNGSLKSSTNYPQDDNLPQSDPKSIWDLDHGQPSAVSTTRSPTATQQTDPRLCLPSETLHSLQQVTSSLPREICLSKCESGPQTDPVDQAGHSAHSPKLTGRVLNRDKVSLQDNSLAKTSTTLTSTNASVPQQNKPLQFCQDSNEPAQYQRNSVSRTSTVIQETLSISDTYYSVQQSSTDLPQESIVTVSNTSPKMDVVHQAKYSGHSLSQKDPNKANQLVNDDLSSRSFLPQYHGTLQSDSDSRSSPDQDISFSENNRKEFTSSSATTALVTQQTVYHSAISDAYFTLSQSSNDSSQESIPPSTDLLPPANQTHSLTDSGLHKDRMDQQDTDVLKSSPTPPQHCLDSFSHDLPSSEATKEARSCSSVPPQLPPTDASHRLPQTSSFMDSHPDFSFPREGSGLPEVLSPEAPRVSSIRITSRNKPRPQQCPQTLYSLHQALTSISSQQCVHDHGMTPGGPSGPEVPPPAFTQQANPHVPPPPSPPHLLTPDQDPDICQPVAIREEIWLTPQIQGPPLPPAPVPQGPAEAIPQGKASRLGPPRITRPRSRATIMGGTPVTLEVEVMGHLEPRLTWSGRKDAELQDGGGARGLLDAIAAEDWLICFGLLCLLLFLLYFLIL